LVMPAATPPTMIARLNREANDILKSTEGTEALVAQGMAAEPGPPEALTERIRGDIAKRRGVAVKAGTPPEEELAGRAQKGIKAGGRVNHAAKKGRVGHRLRWSKGAITSLARARPDWQPSHCRCPCRRIFAGVCPPRFRSCRRCPWNRSRCCAHRRTGRADDRRRRTRSPPRASRA